MPCDTSDDVIISNAFCPLEGYYDSWGISSVHRRDIMITLGDIMSTFRDIMIHVGDIISVTLKDIQYIGDNMIHAGELIDKSH